MRNELNKIQLIERYLRQELSPEELKSFEAELKENLELQQAVEAQKELVEGVNRLGAKQSIQKAGKKYQFKKLTYKLGIITAILITVAAAYTVYQNTNSLEQELLPVLNEKGEELWADADRYLPAQRFELDLSKDTLIETEGGILFHIPDGAFLDENGEIITSKVNLEIKEALDAQQIINAGLESKSGDRLLESAGMFYINAKQGDKTVQVNPEIGIYAEVPTDEVDPSMQLFEGVRKEDGSIDWVNPTSLDQSLVPVDINSLNFYPPEYEPELTKQGYSSKNKSYKDSLYYSFAWTDQSNCFRLKGTDKGQLGLYFGPANQRIIEWDQFISKTDCGDFEINIILMGRNSETQPIQNLINFTDNFLELVPEMGKMGVGKFQLNGQWKVIDFDPNNIPNEELRVETQKYGNNIHIKQKIKVLHQGTSVISFEVPSNEDQNDIDTLVLAMWFDSNQPLIEEKLESSLLDALADEGTELSDSTEAYGGINPAKIKAIWNNGFSNTLIATKEFEERLQSIFLTCNDNILDVYVNNLDKNLYELDSMAALLCSGEIQAKFQAFAQRKEGKVQVDQKRLKRLQEYYKQQQEILAKAVEKTKQAFWKKQLELNKNAAEKRATQQNKNFERLQDNYAKELDINLRSAYKQLGKTFPNRVNTTAVLTPSNRRYRVTVRNNGWKNVDTYVRESLAKRESLDYTDPKTGKKAVIKYEKASVSIDQHEQYDRVLVYLLPDQLNSFMRMKKSKEGTYNEKLNELLDYHLVVLAYKGEQAFYFSQNDIEAKSYDNVQLTAISENELDKVLKQFGNKKKEDISQELDYLLFEQKESKRQKELQDMQAFRYKIECAIFPCYERAVLEPLSEVVNDHNFAAD